MLRRLVPQHINHMVENDDGNIQVIRVSSKGEDVDMSEM